MILIPLSLLTVKWRGRISRALSPTPPCWDSAESLTKSEADAICQGLEGILKDLQSGTLEIDMTQEDIHTFMEGELTAAGRYW